MAGKTTGDEAAAERLFELVGSSWISQALYVAAELKLADLLGDSPKTVDQLAEATGADRAALGRLLGALSTLEVCAQRGDAFELLPLGESLRADAEYSIRAWTLNWGKYLWPLWAQLLESVRTGKSAREVLEGSTAFEHLAKDPERAAIFNQAMVDLTRLVCRGVVRAYDFSGVRVVADVGGGYGQLLEAILRAHAGLRGMLVDLPHAMEQARRRFRDNGLAERCEFITESFFDSVPAGADLYVLKSIIHDWNDERAGIILRNCRRAMLPTAKLLLVERVLPDRLSSSEADRAIVMSDLNMLVALAAQERTRQQFEELLAVAGFRVARVSDAAANFSVIEALPV